MTLLITEDTFACKCESPNIKQSFQKATVIFSGEVTKLDPFRATFKVQKIWKGESAEELVMMTGTFKTADGKYMGTSCDYSYKNSEKYLIYAYGAEDKLRTDNCSGSKVLKNADKDIQELEKLTKESEKVKHNSYFDFNDKIFNIIQTHQPFSCL